MLQVRYLCAKDQHYGKSLPRVIVLKVFRIWAITFPTCKLSHAYPFLSLEKLIHSAACALAVQQLEDLYFPSLSSEDEDILYFPSYLAKIGLR